MSAKVIKFPDDAAVFAVSLHLADANGEDWAAVSKERLAQIEHIARLALSAMKGGDRG